MAQVDLTNPARRTSQRRITNNRDGVLPSRRNTEAPAVAIRADMRAGYRGDGGADDLVRTLDNFMGSLERGYNAQTMRNTDRYRKEAAEGALDAAAGVEMTPERARSLSYQEAFYRAKAEKEYTTFANETKAAVDDALAQGLGPAEVEALVMERVTSFRDSILETIPTATAQRDTALRLSSLGQELETSISTTIRARTREQFIETVQSNIATRIENGEALDFEGYVNELVSGGIARGEAKLAALNGVLAIALDRDEPNEELLERVLASTQADGKTPSLNAAEQIAVQDRITQAKNLREQLEREQREERRDELVDTLFLKAIDGQIVDEEIIQAGRDGVFEPQEVAQYLGLMDGLRNHVEEGHADEDFILEIQQRIALDRPPSNAQILAWQREGRFGTGRSALRAAVDLLGSASVARRAGRGGGGGGGGGGNGLTARQARANNVAIARSYLTGALDPGEDGNLYQRGMRARAGMEFNRRVVNGEDPMTVAESLARSFQPHIERGRPSAQSPRRRSAPAPIATVRRDSSGRLVMAD